MQLKEILNEDSISAISKKTNISEDNITALENVEFDRITRVKVMGFISILEREYHVDLSKLRDEAAAYYNTNASDERVTLGMPMPVEEKKGKSKLFMLLVVLGIIYAIWYAFSNFDKEKLGAMLPFSEETLSRLIMPEKNTTRDEHDVVKELSIESTNVPEETDTEENTSK